MTTSVKGETGLGSTSWREIGTKYGRTETWRAYTQVATTLLPLAAGFTLMALSLALPYWVTLLLAIPTAGFLVRTFIIMHDCAHSSFLPSRRMNDAIGAFTGYLTLTPFAQWRRDHAIHHASSGDLDRRGHGDVDTITVAEYKARSKKDQFKYRMKRNPFALLLVGPLYLTYSQRFRNRSKATKEKQLYSVWWTNLAIAATIAAFALAGLFTQFVMVFGPVMYMAASAGIFLFYVQHQFEGTYWDRKPEWDYVTASIAGSSYLKLPQPLMWMTGNIGLHHVHHMAPRIPNYLLQEAHDENPLFHKVTVVTLKDTRRAFQLALWDEERNRLISFRELKA